MTRTPHRRAQSIIELAVFGSILIFVIGVMMQQGFGASYLQNNTLMANRMALLASYEGREPFLSPAHKTASIVIMQDRVASSLGKYGPIERVPFVVTGSAGFSTQLFYTTDWVDLVLEVSCLANPAGFGCPATEVIPKTDLIINGQKFTMRMAQPVVYVIRKSGGYVTIRYAPNLMAPLTAATACSDTDTTLLADSSDPSAGNTFYYPNAVRLQREWSGAPRIYTTVVSNSSNYQYGGCDQDYWDYNRNGNYSDDPFSCSKNTDQARWRWKWQSVMDVKNSINVEDGTYGQGDVNGDLSEEEIFDIAAGGCPDGSSWYAAEVMDGRAGDWDSEASKFDFDNIDQMPGIKPDVHVFTRFEDGTRLEITDNGYCQAGTSNCINRADSANIKHQYDIIEREIQMNPLLVGTGSFCDGAASLQPGVEVCRGGPYDASVAVGGGSATPSACMDATVLEKTCFDETTNRLHVRSRIEDLRGRLWKMQTTPAKK